DLLLVADESARPLAAATQLGDERDIHLLAAALQLVLDADDRGEGGAHVRREEILPHVLLGQLVQKLDELVVLLNGRFGHFSGPSWCRRARGQSPAAARLKSASLLVSVSAAWLAPPGMRVREGGRATGAA